VAAAVGSRVASPAHEDVGVSVDMDAAALGWDASGEEEEEEEEEEAEAEEVRGAESAQDAAVLTALLRLELMQRVRARVQ
jgi:hypothetical protein